MPDVRATVAICTRNRATTLARGLRALCEQGVPAHAQWELVVIDNASTDDTQSVIASFQRHLPLRQCVETTHGLSAARNRAVAETRGQYIIFIDDDAVADSHWLAAYLDAFDAWPQAAVFGGPIDVAFDGPLPEWFTRVLPRVESIYASKNLGAEPMSIQPREEMLPFGTNYAIRTVEQRDYVYDTSLGRHPEHPHRGSEETDIMLSILERGLAGRWVPQARVTHLLGVERATTAHIAAHSAAYGEYRATRFPYPGFRVAGAPLSTWWRAARYVARHAWSGRFSSPEVWIEDLIQRSEAIGNLRGLRRSSRVT